MSYGMTLEQMQAELEARLKPSRFRHSLGVSETAVKLSHRFGVDEEKARVAGLLHDCAREFRNEAMVEEAEKRGIAIGEVERSMPLLLHADIGVEQERHRALDLADSDAALLCLLDHSFIAELSCAVVQESGNPRLLFVHAEAVRKLHGRLGYAE